MANETVLERFVVSFGFRSEGAEQVRSQYAALRAGAAVVGAAALAAGAAIASMGRSAADAGDVAQKSSAAVNLQADQYTALAFAADRSGLSIGQLDVGLRSLARNVDDFVAGKGEAQEAFRSLGLRPDEVKRLRESGQLMNVIADRLREFRARGGDATGLLQRIFGRPGGRFVNLLGAGGDALKGLTDRAAQLGIVISQDNADAGAVFVDTLTDIRALLRGVTLDIGFAALPEMQRMAGALLDAGVRARGLVRSGVDAFTERFGGALRAAAPAARVLVGLVAALGAARAARGVAGIASALPGMGAAMSALAVAGGPIAVLLLLLGVIDDIVVTARGGKSVLRDFAKALGIEDETQEWAESVTDLFGAAASAADALSQAVSRLANEIARLLSIDLPDFAEQFRLRGSLALGDISLAQTQAAAGFRSFAAERSSQADRQAQGAATAGGIAQFMARQAIGAGRVVAPVSIGTIGVQLGSIVGMTPDDVARMVGDNVREALLPEIRDAMAAGEGAVQ